MAKSIIIAIQKEAENLLLSGVKPSLAILGRNHYKALAEEVRSIGKNLIQIRLGVFGIVCDISVIEFAVMPNLLTVLGRETVLEKDLKVSTLKCTTSSFTEIIKIHTNSLTLLVNMLQQNLKLVQKEAENLMRSGCKPSLAILSPNHFKAIMEELQYSGKNLLRVRLDIFGTVCDITIIGHSAFKSTLVYGQESNPKIDQRVTKFTPPFFIELREGHVNPVVVQINKLQYKKLYMVGYDGQTIDLTNNTFKVKIQRCEYRFSENEIIVHPLISVN